MKQIFIFCIICCIFLVNLKFYNTDYLNHFLSTIKFIKNDYENFSYIQSNHLIPDQEHRTAYPRRIHMEPCSERFGKILIAVFIYGDRKK